MPEIMNFCLKSVKTSSCPCDEKLAHGTAKPKMVIAIGERTVVSADTCNAYHSNGGNGPPGNAREACPVFDKQNIREARYPGGRSIDLNLAHSGDAISQPDPSSSRELGETKGCKTHPLRDVEESL
jgi:hypothetical protein